MCDNKGYFVVKSWLEDFWYKVVVPYFMIKKNIFVIIIIIVINTFPKAKLNQMKDLQPLINITIITLPTIATTIEKAMKQSSKELILIKEKERKKTRGVNFTGSNKNNSPILISECFFFHILDPLILFSPTIIAFSFVQLKTKQ